MTPRLFRRLFSACMHAVYGKQHQHRKLSQCSFDVISFYKIIPVFIIMFHCIVTPTVQLCSACILQKSTEDILLQNFLTIFASFMCVLGLSPSILFAVGSVSNCFFSCSFGAAEVEFRYVYKLYTGCVKNCKFFFITITFSTLNPFS